MTIQIPEVPKEVGARGDPRRSILLAIVAIGLMTFATVVIVMSRGAFQRMFADFEIPPSALTSALLSPVFALALVVLTVLTIAKEFVPRANSIANVWNAIVTVVAMVSLLMFMIAIYSPLAQLIESLS